jgi:WD40 repeat protein
MYSGLVAAVLAMTWVAVDRAHVNSLGQVAASGIVAGSVVGLVVALAWYGIEQRPPGRIRVAADGTFQRLSRGFVHAASTWLIVPMVMLFGGGLFLLSTTRTMLNTLLYLGLLLATVVSCLAAAIVSASIAWLDTTPARPDSPGAAAVHRHDRTASWVGALISALSAAPLSCLTLYAGFVVAQWLVGASTGGGGWPGNTRLDQLARVRTADVVDFFGGSRWVAAGAVLVLPTVTAFVVYMTSRSWFRFQLFRLPFAGSVDLSFDPLGFLEDSRRRGLLRVTGGVYRFRHVRLQERLAAGALIQPDDPAAPARERRRQWLAVGVAAAVVVATVGVATVTLPEDVSFHSIQGRYGLGPYSVALSAGGEWLAMYSHRDDQVLVQKVKSTDAPIVLPGHNGGVDSVIFSPDGTLVLTTDRTAADGTVAAQRIWRTGTGQHLLSTEPHESMMLLDGGSVIAKVTEDNTTAPGREQIALYPLRPNGPDLAVGQPEIIEGRLIGKSSSGLRFQTWSSYARRSTLVTESPAGGVEIRHATGKDLTPLGSSVAASEVLATADGRLIVSRRSGSLRAWQVGTDVTEHSEVTEVTEVTEGALAGESAWGFDVKERWLITTSGGSPLTTADDDTVRVWDTATLAPVRAATRFTAGAVLDLALADTRLLVVEQGARSYRLTVVDLDNTTAPRPFEDVIGHTFNGPLLYLVQHAHPDVLKVWDMQTRGHLHDVSAAYPIVPRNTSNILEDRLVTGPSGRFVATENSAAETSALVDLTTGAVHQLEPRRRDLWYAGSASAVLVDTTGVRLLHAGGPDITLRGLPGTPFVSTTKESERGRLSVNSNATLVYTQEPDAEAVTVWDACTGNRLQSLTGHIGAVSSFAVLQSDRAGSDGPVADWIITSGASDDSVRIWRGVKPKDTHCR